MVRIRPAVAADRTFVLEMAERLAGGFPLPPWRSAAEVIAGDRRDLDAWFEAPDRVDERMLIAEADGRRLGVAHVVTAIDFFTRRPHAHLSVLAVAADAEGRGVGSALIDAAADWSRAQGFDRLTLSVFESNERARRVYARRGFEPELVKYVKWLDER